MKHFARALQRIRKMAGVKVVIGLAIWLVRVYILIQSILSTLGG